MVQDDQEMGLKWSELAMELLGKSRYRLENDLRYSGNSQKLPGTGQGTKRSKMVQDSKMVKDA